jgi:hypothetical protein
MWVSYERLVMLWWACGGSFSPANRIAAALPLWGLVISLVSALLAGLFAMEMARGKLLKKWQCILVVRSMDLLKVGRVRT